MGLVSSWDYPASLNYPYPVQDSLNSRQPDLKFRTLYKKFQKEEKVDAEVLEHQGTAGGRVLKAPCNKLHPQQGSPYVAQAGLEFAISAFPGLGYGCVVLYPTSLSDGQTDLQVSQQFQQVSRILEATNSSLQQQLREEKRQLKQREDDLRESRRELNSTQDTFQEKQKMYEVTKQQLQDCQAESQRTKESLKTEEQRRQDLDQSLRNTRDALRRLSSCSSGTCSGIRETGAGGRER